MWGRRHGSPLRARRAGDPGAGTYRVVRDTPPAVQIRNMSCAVRRGHGHGRGRGHGGLCFLRTAVPRTFRDSGGRDHDRDRDHNRGHDE